MTNDELRKRIADSLGRQQGAAQANAPPSADTTPRPTHPDSARDIVAGASPVPDEKTVGQRRAQTRRRGAEDLAILQRMDRVSYLYLQGRRQWEIAKILGITPDAVSRDLRRVRNYWLRSTLRSFDQLQAKELARIDALERTYWTAWRRSLKKRETKSTEQVDDQSGSTKTKAAIRQEDRDGNPSYLAGVERCIELRAKLLGLITQKIDSKVEMDIKEARVNLENLSDEELAAMDRARSVLERYAPQKN